MYSLLIVAVATFTGIHTGHTVTAYEPVASLQQYADAVNQARTEQYQGSDGDTYVITSAQVVVMEEK
jgi:hypothetical protein